MKLKPFLRLSKNVLNMAKLLSLMIVQVTKQQSKQKNRGAIVLNNSSPNGYDNALNTGFNYALKKNY